MHLTRPLVFLAIAALSASLAHAQDDPAAVSGEAPAAQPAVPGPMQMTSTGLEYQVLVEGSGPKPIRADTVTVHYEGKLTSGSVFDSSYRKGSPTSFSLTRVIKGWTEGLQLMSVGSKYKFIVPPYLGYGADGSGDAIPPNATLIFEIELLKIN